MEDNNFIIDNMTWSFSRINSFYGGCKKEWNEKYVECLDSCSSFDGQAGGVAHETFEAYFNGEIDEYDMASYFEDLYSKKVTYSCPYPNGDTKFGKILEYFENFSFDKNKYEIIGVEKEIRYKIKDKYPFVGYIDLLLRDKETGEIIVLDHKSSTIKILKNGNVSKSDLEHFIAFKRQLLLYSYAVLKEYGSVSKLKWNMFKDGTSIEIDWTEKDMNDAIDWAYDTIQKIEKETEFPACPDYYYCVNLCSRRMDYCPYKRLGMIYDGIYSKCYNPKNKEFEEYGGSMITMCDEWKNDKNEFFKWALESDEYSKTLANELIKTVPDYFWTVPASSTGKYHPTYALGDGGLYRHTVALCRIMNHLFEVSTGFTPREKDLLLIAGIMHDSRKSGSQTEYESNHYTNFDHPLKAANVVRQFKNKSWNNNEIELIANAIESHMGKWNTDKRSNVVLPTPQNKYQTMLHWCDYLASRKDLEVKFGE